MASDVLGKQFDIHSGGIDLAFPHHDNELAQSEAYWCNEDCGKVAGEQWVNYFLHMGHLSIQGSKMSKSLKNFTTIREALARGDWTPRGLRIVFLLGAWRDGLEITGEVVKAGRAWEDKVDNLFLKIQDVKERYDRDTGRLNGGIGNGSVNGPLQNMKELSIAERERAGRVGPVVEELEAAQDKFRDALCDSFDTPSAMRVLSDLITLYNSQPPMSIADSVSIELGQWVTDMVGMFGLDADYKPGAVGWSGLQISPEAKAFVEPLAHLRDRVREQAKAGAVDIHTLGCRFDHKESIYPANQPYANANARFERKIVELNKANASPKEYLAACDYARDKELWDLGIYLEDRDGQPALIRPLSQTLREERASRDAVVASKAAAKEKTKADAEAAERKKAEQGKTSQLDMFRTSEYSAWDSEGLPTHDAEGKEVAKSRSKKLRKDWDRQRKLHEAWKEAAGKDAGKEVAEPKRSDSGT